MSTGMYGLMIEALQDQLLALTNRDLKGEELAEEMRRSRAVNETVNTMTNVGKMAMQAAKLTAEYGEEFNKDIPKELKAGE